MTKPGYRCALNAALTLATGAASSAPAQFVPTLDRREVWVRAEAALNQQGVSNTHTHYPATPYAPWYILAGESAQIEYLYGGSTATQGSVIADDHMAATLHSSSRAYGGPPGGAGGFSRSRFAVAFRIYQFPVQVRIVGFINAAAQGGTAQADFNTVSPPMSYSTTNGLVTYNELRTLTPGEYWFTTECTSGSDSIAGPPPCHSDAHLWLTTHTNDCLYVLGQPVTISSYPGATASFQFPVVGVPTMTFRWRRDGVTLFDGPTASGSVISGADTDLLQISNLSAADQGTYDCTAFNPCSSAASNTADLIVCYSNCDASTSSPYLNVLDFACFLNAFAAGDSYANCDGSTTPPVLNVGDFACFLNAFAAGCP